MQTLGIDLGGTFARAAVVDEQGTLLGVAKTALTDRTPQGVVEAIAGAAASALQQAPGAKVTHCGVGVAAQLEGPSGFVLVAPNLGWRNVPFGELLSRRLNHAVRVVNDLSAAAWGEFSVGASRGAREVWTVFVGSGVGSAIIANGQLVHGARGVAGELGHVKVVPNGRLCGCGEHGCVEAYAGGHQLILQMKDALEAGKAPLLAELAAGQEPSPSHLEKAAEAGDPEAKVIYQRALDYLSLCLGNQLTMLNPAKLILGGGVLMHAPNFRKQLEKRALVFASVASRTGLEVHSAALGDDSGLIGAALLAAPS